jgi:nucleotidyltransferase substrate binding protein (TIGR01987 family)
MKKISISGSSFINLKKAFASLDESLQDPVVKARDLSGIIKDFELVYELSWKVLKKYLEQNGIQSKSPRDVFTQAYKNHCIDQDKLWVSMIEDRNLAVHVYDKEQAKELVQRIRALYFPLFESTFDF